MTRAQLARRAWIGYWRAQQRWHRYTVVGAEHLEGPAALIVGYHGRSIARDLCMFTAWAHDHLGVTVHPIVHRAAESVPALRPLLDGASAVCADGPAVAAVLARGEHVVVTPGGTREGCRPFSRRYTVDWGGRMGYLRLALRHGLDIVPAAAAGTDHTYLGLNDGYVWGKRLNVPFGLPAWVGLGPLGPWPLSPPFPVRVRQHFGPQLRLPALDPDDTEALERQHRRVVATVQGVLDRAVAS